MPAAHIDGTKAAQSRAREELHMKKKKLTAGERALQRESERKCLPEAAGTGTGARRRRKPERLMLWIAIAILIVGITIPTISGAVVRGGGENEQQTQPAGGPFERVIENICRLALGDTDTSGTEEDTSLRDSGADTESSTETDAETDIKKTPADSEAETVGGRTETDKTDSPETKSEERTEPSEKTEDEVLVLILHTHTTEAYRDGADPGMPGRSLDSAQNMLAVGQALEDALAAHGIGAVQCTAVFDYPSVIGAYDRAYGEADQMLARYPSIRYIVDLHRMDDGGCAAAQTMADGKTVAQIRLLAGKSRGMVYGLAEAKALSALLCGRNTALCLPVRIAESAMGHDRAGALGITVITAECGNTNNTLEEAKRAATYLGDALADYLRTTP